MGFFWHKSGTWCLDIPMIVVVKENWLKLNLFQFCWLRVGNSKRTKSGLNMKNQGRRKFQTAQTKFGDRYWQIFTCLPEKRGRLFKYGNLLLQIQKHWNENFL